MQVSLKMSSYRKMIINENTEIKGSLITRNSFDA